MPTGITHLQCLCGAVREPASLLECTELPVETELCHCNVCRYTSGALCGAFVRLRDKPTSIGSCARYTRPGGRVDRYFCSTCGTRTYDHVTDTDYWLACSGILEPDHSHENVIKITQHEYVSDTIDGGLVKVLQSLEGRTIPCYAGGKDMSDAEMTPTELAQVTEGSVKPREDKLYGSCHCGAIHFYIHPPQPDATRWGSKYPARSCACRFCRLAFGFSFASWTYIPPENVVVAEKGQASRQETRRPPEQQASAEPVFDYTSRDAVVPDFATFKNLQTRFPSLKFYYTSPVARWGFCTTCGATVFSERETRPQVVNISVGVLRAQSGALAKDWLDFVWRVWWEGENAADKQFVEAFEDEARRLKQDEK